MDPVAHIDLDSGQLSIGRVPVVCQAIVTALRRAAGSTPTTPPRDHLKEPLSCLRHPLPLADDGQRAGREETQASTTGPEQGNEAGAAHALNPEAAARAVALECAECGIRLTGEDIVALASVGMDESETSAKLERLRHGYCARNGCSSRHYRLTRLPGSGLDWNQVKSALSTQLEAVAESAAGEEAARLAELARAQKRKWLRVGLGLLVLLLLLMVRQWYRGGTIPFLREPEKFRADPSSREVPPPP